MLAWRQVFELTCGKVLILMKAQTSWKPFSLFSSFLATDQREPVLYMFFFTFLFLLSFVLVIEGGAINDPE